MKLQTKETIGFTIEMITFVMTGYFIALHKYILAIIIFVIAFTIAIWVGRLIGKIALEEKGWVDDEDDTTSE